MPMFNPAHPGEVLREYMGSSMSVTGLAESLGMTRANLSMILNGRAGISAATALKLSETFRNTSPEFWLKMQNNYDLWIARQSSAKSTNPEYEPAKIYVRKQTRKEARRKWEDTTGGDFSDLVQHLLSEYISS